MTEIDCNEATRQGRMEKAEQFHLAAQVIEEYAAGEEDLNDAYITLCVHAGIAAADVICCARLGKHHQGQNHHEAISLLERADRSLADSLSTLLSMKTQSGYSATPSSSTKRKRAGRAVARLIQAADRVKAT